MDVKTELSRIYPEYKIFGPYRSRSDGRAYFVKALLVDGKIPKHGFKTSVLVSRATMEISLGRSLTANEQVDHIDGDCKNDEVSNLQVLTTNAHYVKSGKEASIKFNKKVLVSCPCCRTNFLCMHYRVVNAAVKNRSPCCTRSCSSKHYGSNQFKDWGN